MSTFDVWCDTYVSFGSTLQKWWCCVWPCHNTLHFEAFNFHVNKCTPTWTSSSYLWYLITSISISISYESIFAFHITILNLHISSPVTYRHVMWGLCPPLQTSRCALPPCHSPSQQWALGPAISDQPGMVNDKEWWNTIVPEIITIYCCRISTIFSLQFGMTKSLKRHSGPKGKHRPKR